MLSFNQRLLAVKAKGELTITDLAGWLGISRETVRAWTTGVVPSPLRFGRVEASLVELEAAVKEGHFPMPLSVTQYDRAAYVKAVIDGKLKRLSGSRVAVRRAKVRRLPPQRRDEA
jgi:hypothetical protein